MRSNPIFDVRDHVVIVTGAASGLGFAFAEILAQEGAHVVLADINEPGVGEKTERLRAAGGSVESVVLDIGDGVRVRSTIAEVAKRHGRLDTVFANAGISGGPGSRVEAGKLVNVDLLAFERVMHVNLTGVLATVQAAAEQMIPHRRGRIVVTASATGLKVDPWVSYAYSISKAAVVHLVKNVAIELAEYGVLVAGLAPGPIFTNLAGGLLSKNSEARAAVERSVPLGRIGEPDDLKGLALYLASPASSYLTGSVIAIDGGSAAA